MSENHICQLLASRELGGAEVVALALSDFLRTRGEQSMALIPGPGPARDAAIQMRLEVGSYYLGCAFGRGKLRPAFANGHLLRRLWGRKPGLVHVHAPHVYAALRRSLRWSGLKTVVHVHLAAGQGGFDWALRTPPDLVITCAKFFRDGVTAAIPESRRASVRIEAVSNAVDLTRFCPSDRRAAKSRLGFAPGIPVLLMLANLAPHKGQATAIRAVAELACRGMHVECWLAGAERAGSEGYGETLRELAASLGVADRVRLLGFRSDITALLAAADIVLLPSTDEGLPLTLLEAQACERAVIAAPTAGIPEIIDDGVTGFLIAADDHAGYAARIEALLRDANLYAQLTKRARHLVEVNHSWTAYCERIWELYQDVLRVPATIVKKRSSVTAQRKQCTQDTCG